MTLAPIHPTFDTEPTPLFEQVAAARPTLRVIDGGTDLPHIPRCRPTERRLAILNGGIDVTGALLWSI